MTPAKLPSSSGPDSHFQGQPVVISVDGACEGNGTGRGRASAGIYVGDRSQSNESIPLNLDNPTNQKPEIMAGIHGLNKAREMDGGPSRHVIIKSDSQYMVKGVNEWSHRWESNGYRAANGQPVANGDLFRELNAAKDSLEKSDVKVDFQHVPREQNWDADHWANRVLSDHIPEPYFSQDKQDGSHYRLQDRNPDTWFDSYLGLLESSLDTDPPIISSDSSIEKFHEHFHQLGPFDHQDNSSGNDVSFFEHQLVSPEPHLEPDDSYVHESYDDDCYYDDSHYDGCHHDDSYYDDSYCDDFYYDD
ncbi:putative ribonuclease H [Microsporum ferrugineum]